MPPIKFCSPYSLEKLCFFEIMKHFKRELNICNHLQHFEKTSLLLRRRGLTVKKLREEIANYLDVLPPLLSEMVRQDITNVLMLSAKTEQDSTDGTKQTLQMLEIVLNNEIKNIEFSTNDSSIFFYSSIIWELILKCTGLQRLALMPDMFYGSKVEIRRFIIPWLTKLTDRCPALTELILKDNISTTESLQVIGRNCKHLRVLDVTGSRVSCTHLVRLCLMDNPVISAASNMSIMRTALYYAAHSSYDRKFYEDQGILNPLCDTMEVLLLTNTNVRARGASLLLKLIPTLTSLGDLVYTAAGLKNIYSLIKNKQIKTLRLEHMFYRGPSNVKLKILANCCPRLQSLYLGSRSERRIYNQLHLNSLSFKMLQKLTLENIHCQDIGLALQHAPNVTDLKIDTSGLDLSYVIKHCPMVRELTLMKEPSKELAHLKSDQPCFTELEVLKIFSPISLVIASIFWKNAGKLRSVEMVRVRDVDDNVFLTWLDVNPLSHLETLMIRYISLTKRSIERLLMQCPCLTKLGEMGGWDIRSWECRRLKDMITSKGYDLDLVLYTAASQDIFDIFNDSMSDDDSLYN